VKPQNHHPQSISKQAKETTKAKNRKKKQTNKQKKTNINSNKKYKETKNPKRKPRWGGRLPREKGQN
jgi:hypothetical protein